MRLLLDTPVWVWSLLEPERLSGRVRAALEGQDSELWLSPLSILQLVALIEEGRVVVDADAGTWLEDALRTVPVREATVSHEVARRVALWARADLDAGARLLAATAQVYDLTLVTADRRLADLEGVRVLANR